MVITRQVSAISPNFFFIGIFLFICIGWVLVFFNFGRNKLGDNFTMGDFKKGFGYVLQNEGGYTNDANDSGGPTTWGITMEEYARFKGRGVSIDEVKKISQKEAETIYKRNYWDVLNLDGVKNDAVATAIFDQAVNRGVRTVAKAIQGIVGVPQDGHFGPITLKAINSAEEKNLIEAISKEAANSYKQIADKNPKNKVFLRGWLARARRLLALK